MAQSGMITLDAGRDHFQFFAPAAAGTEHIVWCEWLAVNPDA